MGYVFRDRFYSQDILNKNQLYNCIRYIHNNPMKAKIVKSMSEYKYSSYNEFLGKKSVISNESIKLIFGSIRNYQNQFIWIHSKCTDENFIDEEEKEDIYNFIKDFEKRNHININEINKDRNLLEMIIREARKKTNVTIIQLSKILNISKSTVGRYVKKK